MQRKVGMMGKKSVVVEIMEKRLSPHGFQYVSYNNGASYVMKLLIG